MDENESKTTIEESLAQSPAEGHTEPAPAPSDAPAEPTPEETVAALDHEETPAEIILTIRMRKLLFFAVKDAEVKVLQGEAVVDTVRTDGNGQALFKLKPGEYTVISDGKSVGIDLKQNATVKL